MTKKANARALILACLIAACGGDDDVAGSGGVGATGGVGGAAGVGGTGGVGGTAATGGSGTGGAGVGGTGGTGGTSGTGGVSGSGGTGGTAVTARPRNRIDTSSEGVCAISSANRPVCWGGIAELPPDQEMSQLQAEFDWGCALDLGGHAFCWGSDLYAAARDSAPTQEVFTDIAITGASVNGTGACGITLDRRVVCWSVLGVEERRPAGSGIDLGGSTRNVCIGSSSRGNVQNWPDGDELVGAFDQVACGRTRLCGLRADGTAACRNTDGGEVHDPPPGPFVQVAAGWEFACGIRPSGEVECWGDAPIDTPPAGPFEEIALGTHACGIRTSGEVVCWKGPRASTDLPAPPQGFVAKTGP